MVKPDTTDDNTVRRRKDARLEASSYGFPWQQWLRESGYTYQYFIYSRLTQQFILK